MKKRFVIVALPILTIVVAIILWTVTTVPKLLPASVVSWLETHVMWFWAIVGIIFFLCILYVFLGSIVFLPRRWFRLAKDKSKEDKTITKLTDLKISTKVRAIQTAGHYDRALAGGLGGAEGDKYVTIDVVLTPSKPLTVYTLTLRVQNVEHEARIYGGLNESFSPLKATPFNVVGTQAYDFIFTIPEKLAVDTDDAKICANSEFFSEPFEIKFGGSK